MSATPRTDALLPCPFCGSTATLADLAGWEITCNGCGTNVSGDDASLEAAVALWNTRIAQSYAVRAEEKR